MEKKAIGKKRNKVREKALSPTLQITKCCCTAEPQRSQREMFLLLQSGDGDWSRISVPLAALSRERSGSGMRSNPFTALALIASLLTKKQKPSSLSASPDKQEILSLRPRRLCGEKSILDKDDLEYHHQRQVVKKNRSW